ncbi:MAG: type I pullulanase [Erysipelotrichaceae bacterium]|nr:type I pullulanase [Erysipelotrichaceae bacterium]
MRKDEIMEAYLDRYDLIVVYIHEQFYQGKSETFRLRDEDGNIQTLAILSNERSSRAYNKYKLVAPKNIVIGKEYTVTIDYALQCPLRFGYVVRTEEFDQQFYYDGNDLGATYSSESTSFAVWAPTATAMKVELQKENQMLTVAMKRTDKGVYRATVNGDFDGASYVYLAKVNGQWVQAVDPYAKSCNANKERGFVINPKRTEMDMHTEQLPKVESYTDCIIYETHVRDFTKQLPHPWAGKYLGLTLEGLKTPIGKPAGLDYLKTLGITHLQLQPVNDFTSVDEYNVNAYYNWGYDPGHYNCPEGSYATDPNDPYSRVNELKQVIAKLHENKIRVILDVVYNHMQSQMNSDFEKLVPNYYFRLSDSGAPSNGSFCGNDFDSTRLMSRKFIVDSISMWMKDYSVDGFRFDLMGILDIETMNAIKDIAMRINPNVFLHGEGWNMPTILPDEKKATLHNQDKLDHIGQFNDFFREHVKGKSNEHEVMVKGFCTGDTSYIYAIPACLSGCVLKRDGYVTLFDSPNKSTNYVECHDNGTVWDKMKVCCTGEDNATRIQRQKMMLALVLLSQGVPFIHSGQEFCRTKNGVQNSYASSDLINRLDWDRKDKYEQVVDYTMDMIQLRKRLSALRMRTAAEIEQHAKFELEEQKLLVYRLVDIKQYDGYEELMIMINPTTQILSRELKKSYQILANDDGLVHDQTLTDQIQIEPLSVVVLAR